MSRFEIHSVRCPACGRPQQVNIYVSITANRLRGATDGLMDGSWERFACEACGHSFTAEHRLLYTDLPRKRWIVQYPRAEHARFAALEEEAAAVFRQEYLVNAPDYIRSQASGVAPRICFGRPQLAEKLLAWQHDIDDRALECLKLAMLRTSLDALLPLGPSELQLDTVEPERLAFTIARLESGAPLDRVTVDPATLAGIAADLASFRTGYPELFERPFVNASRYLL